jgi:peptide/nickel transport system permease protein
MGSRILNLIVSRVAQGTLVLLFVSAITFALLAAAGGDAVTALYDDPHVTEEVINRLRASYGLDRPLPVRYARWLGGVLTGDFGFSFYYRAPVGAILSARLKQTLLLGGLALAIAWALALAIGWPAARRRGRWADRLAGAVVVIASSTPRIVLALFALVFAARAALFSGTGAEAGGATFVRALLAASVLSVPLVAVFLAQTREGLRAALDEDFVRVARAKGLGERAVVGRHALRAALNPLITVFGISLAGVVSGSVVVETVLGWPGLGQLSVVAVRSRDVPLLMGVVLVTSTAVLAGNLLADIALRLNDPRIGWHESRRTDAGE